MDDAKRENTSQMLTAEEIDSNQELPDDAMKCEIVSVFNRARN